MMQPRNGILQPMHSMYQQRFSPINNNYSNSNNNYLSAVPQYGSNLSATSLLQPQQNHQQQQQHGSINMTPQSAMAPVDSDMSPNMGDEQQFRIDDMNEENCVGTTPIGDYNTLGACSVSLCNRTEQTEPQDMLGIDGDREELGTNVRQNTPLTNRTSEVSNFCEHQGSSRSTDDSRKCSSNIVWTDMPTKPHVFFQKGSSSVAGPAFTFTTPTQSSLYSPAVMARMGTSFVRATPHTFTPTACTPWQHAVPQRLAWSRPGLTRMQGVSIFTGSMSSCSVDCSQASGFPLCSSSQIRPIPSSHSQPPRRPKRHSSENLDYLSPTNKIRLTDEKIAQHMQELRIHNQSVSNSSSIATDPTSRRRSSERCAASPGSPWVGVNKSSGHRRNTHHSHMTTDDQWQNYKALEEKLNVSDDDSDSEKDETTMSKQPSLHIVEQIDRLIPSQATIPQDILEKIQRPRMEVVLWTPPEGSVKKLINGSFSDSKTDTSALEAVDTELSTIVEDDSGMEMDLAEDMFEL